MLEFIISGRGPKRSRAQFCRMLIEMDVTSKVLGFSLLEYLICYGGDDDFPLIEQVVRLDCVSEYRNLLNLVYSGSARWNKHRRELVRLLISNGVHRVDVQGYRINRDSLFLHAHGIQNDGDFMRTIEKYKRFRNGHYLIIRAPWRLVRKLLRCGLLPEYEYKDHLPTGIALSMGVDDVIIRTAEDILDHLRRGVYDVDEYGMRINKSMEAVSRAAIMSLFDVKLSPCVGENGTVLEYDNVNRLRYEISDWDLTVLRRFPQLLTSESGTICKFIRYTSLSRVQDLLTIPGVVPGFWEMKNVVDEYAKKTHTDMAVLESVARTLAPHVDEVKYQTQLVEDVFRRLLLEKRYCESAYLLFTIMRENGYPVTDVQAEYYEKIR